MLYASLTKCNPQFSTRPQNIAIVYQVAMSKWYIVNFVVGQNHMVISRLEVM